MTFEEVQIGIPLGPRAVFISKDRARRCARAFGLDLPRFTDDEGARKEGLARMILPGSVSLALMTKLVTDWISGSKARLVRLGTTYRILVEPDRTLTLQGFVTNTYPGERRCEIDLWIENEDAARLVTGSAAVDFIE